MKIKHKTTFLDRSRIAKELDFTPAMQKINPDKTFPLLEDPQVNRKALIMGMFVLRSAYRDWTSPIIKEDGTNSIYDIENWIYNLNSINGGGVIANGNLMDAYRLGMQYALSDAVIVGSTTVINDGTPKPDGTRGYLWMPYECANWPHLKEADPHMLERFAEQRESFRKQGYASNREYPAQITVSRSGKASDPDLLSASIFHEKHPDGAPIEAYIITSIIGAEKIKIRAAQFGLEDRIDDILIIQSSPDSPEELDLETLPERLYREFDMKLVNHDGGAMVLEAFCKAGIIPQFNFTFARTPALRKTIEKSPIISDADRPGIIENYDNLIVPVFSNSDGKLPKEIKVAQIIQDEYDEAVVAILDTRGVKGF
jgi:hypothetical protein